MTKDANASAVEQNNETKPADNENVVNQTADTGNDTPNSVPYARFNEVNKNYKSLQEKLSTLEKKQEEDRTTQMEEQGKYKELNAELRTENEKLKEKNNFYIEQEAKERESLLESLSDNDKTIYGDLPTDKLKQHVSNIVTKTTVRTDKSQPIRGNNFDKDIWAMEDKDKKSNWTDYIRSLTKKS